MRARSLLQFALLALLAPLVVAAPAVAVEDVTPARVEGPTRVDTAAAIAALTHPDGVEAAVVATSEHFQDALVGAGLAGSTVAAQLLVRPDEVPDATAEALQDLGVQRIQLLGDTDRVSAAVEEELAATYDVTRIAGDTPPELAVAVAQTIDAQTGLPLVEGGPTVLIAHGERFPDAVAGSAPAHHAGMPVLFSDTDALYPATAAVLDEHAIQTAVVLGGTDAIDEAVIDQIQQRGIDTVRLAGPSRVETSLAVADWAEQTLDFDFDGLLIARGDDFPDSLTAAQYGGTAGDPIILTATPEQTSESALNWIRTRCPVIEVVRAVGGTQAITTGLLNDIETAAESCADDGPPADGEGSWSAMAEAPIERINHTAVWDGEELLVWGGGERPADDGAAYEPSTDTWRTISAAPIEPRWVHEAVWADEHEAMIVYGGSTGPDHLADCFDDGAMYDPADDTWAALPANPHSDAGCGTSVVWTGSELIVWGGHAGGTGAPAPVGDGAAYDPATDEWRAIADSPLGPRWGHDAVWTGAHMIVVGGTDADHRTHGDAAAYDPGDDSWTTLPDAPIPPRDAPAVTWTGAEVVVTGGSVDAQPRSDGAAYDPVAQTWRTIPDLPGSHTQPIAEGSDIGLQFVVGGERDGRQPAAVAWDPTAPEWMELADLPGGGRTNHTVTWADDRLLVFGGQNAAGTSGGHAWSDDR